MFKISAILHKNFYYLYPGANWRKSIILIKINVHHLYVVSSFSVISSTSKPRWRADSPGMSKGEKKYNSYKNKCSSSLCCFFFFCYFFHFKIVGFSAQYRGDHHHWGHLLELGVECLLSRILWLYLSLLLEILGRRYLMFASAWRCSTDVILTHPSSILSPNFDRFEDFPRSFRSILESI